MKHKNFLKKLTAGILGFVMTLGVGAAGYSASANESKAADATISLTSIGASLSSTDSLQTVSVNGYGLKIQGKKQGSSAFLTKNSGYIYNTTAIPGPISKITLKTNSGASGSAKYAIAYSSTAISSKYTSGSSTVNIGAGSTRDFTCSVSNAKYFCVWVDNAANGQVLDLTVAYSAATYTVSFDPGIGSGSMNPLSNVSSLESAPECKFTPPTGYEFNYWSTSSGGSAITFPLTLTGNTTFYANWKEEGTSGFPEGTYSMTLDVDSMGLSGSYPSSIPATVTVKAKETTTQQEVQIELKYGSVMKNSNMQFKKSGDGYIYNTTNLEKIDSVVINETSSNKLSYYLNTSQNPSSSASSGPCGFFKVYSNSGNAGYADSIVVNFTIESKVPKHSVEYLKGATDATGTAPTQPDVAEGKTFSVAANTFTRTGYTFNGWKDQNGTSYSAGVTYTMGTSDVTLTAQWAANSYNLAYNANGGTGTVAGGSHAYGSTFNLSSSTFTKSGYTQDGWATSTSGDKAYELGGSYTYNTAGAVTLYAHWVPNNYTITYDSNGGEGTVADQTAAYQSSVTLASSGFTKAHYDLDGWATSSDGGVAYSKGESISMPLGGLTLYAHYSIQSHTVLYNGNGGTADKASDTVQYGKDVDLTVGATYPGFTLLGWALSSDATVGLNSLTMEDSDITLYAVWKEDERTYAFNAYANDGVTSEPNHISDYRNGADITMPYFEDFHISRSGYTALGWSTTSTGEVEYEEGEAAKMGNSALNIYVVWQKHLDEKPTLTLSGSTSMWVGKSQTLTINYTAGAETLEVSASPSGVVSLAQVSDVSGVRTYTVSAVGAGTATITAGDSFYSDSVSITATADYLDSVTIAGSLPSGTYYEGDSLSIANAISNLTIAGQMKSGDSVTIPKNAATWTFADGSSSVKLAAGMTKVTVVAVYNEVESNELVLAITVTPVTMESLTVNYTGGQPILGTTFSFAGSITANMSNGTHPTVNLSDVEIGAVDRFTLNQQTITVTHKTTGATGAFNVQYKAKEITYNTSWQKVTATQTDWSGEYLLAYEDTTNSKTLFWTGVDAGHCHSDITTPSDYKLSSIPDGASSLIIAPMDGGYSIKVSGGSNNNKYIGQSSYANGMSFNDNAQLNTISLDNNGNAVICGTGSTTDTSGATVYVQMKYNKATGDTNERFRYYKSGQENVILYKKIQTPITQPSIIKIDASLKEGKTFNEGATISPSDFNVSALYDTGTTGGVTATSVSPTKLGPGDNTITVNYNSFSDTVVVPAAEIAHLDRIEVVNGTGQRSFERLDEFDYTGLEVMAYYSNTDKTTFPDHKVSNFSVDPSDVDMSETGTYTVGVSYTENGVTKTASYNVTVTPKTSTYVTIEGDGIEGSSGSYALTSPVQKTVDLTIGHDGDEEITFSTESSFLSYSNGQLVINSSTTTTETGTITFSAGSASATLTVTVTASETIQLISDEHVSGFIGDEFEVNIALGNVADATWTLPSASDGFIVKTTSKDNTGFVGTISVSEECVNKEAVFSVVTGKGKTLSVSVYVSAQVDAIDSISATCSKSYVAGQDSFDKSDLTVTYERLSGATGTLTSDEFTVTGAPTGKLARGSYNLTITSIEGEKTCSCTISASMPTGLNVVTAHTEEIPGQPTTSWSKLTSASQLDSDEKVYISLNDSQYVTGYSGDDATLSATSSDRIEFTVEIVSSSNGTFRLFNPTSEKYITSYASNKFGITAETTSTAAVFSFDNNNNVKYTDSKGDSRYLCANGSYYRCYKSIGSYTAFDFYISKTTPGTPTYVTTYTNHESMSGTMFDFINRWGGTELTAANWGDIFGSDEYKALTATDKEWFKTGVVADDEETMESCELFADFITKYDAIAKQYGPEYNTDYLNRDVEYNKYSVSINGVTVASNQVAGTPYTLPGTISGKKAVSYTIDGESYNPGETIKLCKNVVATAQLITDVTSISVSTEANFSYSLDNQGSFSEITKTTLRMYIELDADTYNYYVSQGYDFSIALSNSSSGKTSKIASSQMSVVYDEGKGVYVFNVALNIPSAQYETSLAISLVATKSGEEDVSTKSVSVSYKAAAQALYASYQAGTVELTDNQVAALKAILGIN